MKLIIALAALFSSTAFAAKKAPITHEWYRVKAQIFADGKLISAPEILTLAGEQSTIEQKGDKQHYKMDVTTASAQNGIDLKMGIDWDNGVHKAKAEQRLVVKDGVETQVILNKNMMMKVVALKEPLGSH